MKLKYKVALTLVGLLILAHVYIGYSYSLWMKTYESEEPNTITTGCFTITFEEKTKSISLKNTYPVSDATALAKVKPYQIVVSNTCDTTDAGYSITLNTVQVDTGKTKLDDQFVKVAVGIDGTAPKTKNVLSEMEVNGEIANIDVSGTLLTSYIINTGYIQKGTSKTFNIYLWMDEKATNAEAGKVFKAGVSVTTYSATANNLASTVQAEIEEASENTPQTYSLSNEKEYRYTGANPNNYVLFNEELWRIIGLVNTGEGQNIKLVRNASVLQNTAMNESGGNSWDTSKINEYYKNTFFPSMTDEAKNTIISATWKIGSSADYITNGTALSWQDYEQSSTWDGKIGLLTSSDYGLASGVVACLDANLNSLSSTENCVSNNWLAKQENVWLMNPSATDENNFFIINSEGNIIEQNSTETAVDYPVVYLKNDIILEGGNGTIGNPYRLAK